MNALDGTVSAGTERATERTCAGRRAAEELADDKSQLRENAPSLSLLAARLGSAGYARHAGSSHCDAKHEGKAQGSTQDRLHVPQDGAGSAPLGWMFAA